MRTFYTLSIVLFLVSCSHEKKKITLNSKSVNGLTTGTNITLNNVKIGKVNELSIGTNKKVYFLCELDPKLTIPLDSQFKIKTDSVLETKEIVLELGNSLEEIQSGDILQLKVSQKKKHSYSISKKMGQFFERMAKIENNDSISVELNRLNTNLEKLQTNK